MRRGVTLLALVGLVAAACGTGSGATRELQVVSELMDDAKLSSRQVVYTEEVLEGDRSITVRSEIQDDLRAASVVSIDGTDVLEQRVSDDALAVRVLNADLARPFIELVASDEPDLARALEEGSWLLDHQGAPQLIAPRTSEGTMLVGQNPVLEGSVYAFQYFREAVNEGSGMNEFNPDAIAYNAIDDPWSEDADADLVSQGIRRYDLIQPPLPRPTQRGSQQARPATRHFRKMVFYTKGPDLVRVSEQISIRDRPEFRRAAAGRAAEYYVGLMGQALAGATQDPVRERRMTYEILERGDVEVGLPVENVEVVPALNLEAGVAAIFAPQEPPEAAAGPDELTPGGLAPPAPDSGEESPGPSPDAA